jgi:hypothetical protein
MKKENNEVCDFKRELAYVLNKYSRENLSGTPDYILAEYLNDCLNTLDKTIQLSKSLCKKSYQTGLKHNSK